MGLAEQLQREWPVIQQAPLSFLILAVAVIGAAWVAMSWLHRHQISNLEGRVKLRDDQIADYKRKLDGASPDEAKARLDKLEGEVFALKEAAERSPIKRAITEEHQALITKLAAETPGLLMGAHICYTPNDRDSSRFALAIAKALRAAKCEPAFAPGVHEEGEHGVILYAYDARNLTPGAKRLVEVLEAVGYPPQVREMGDERADFPPFYLFVAPEPD